MKILWHSNAPWAATGYGNQTSMFAPRFKDAGHEVDISAFYGLHGRAVGSPEGITVHPGFADAYGNDMIVRHAKWAFDDDLSTGWIIALMDAWVLNPTICAADGANVAVWAPVDHDPAPERVVEFFKASGAVPVAMSLHGKAQLEAAGLEPLYVPHGVDTDALKPINRIDARKSIGLPEEAFVVGMVAANKDNPSRKAFPECLAAFKAFREKHEDAVLYLHTEATGVIGGVNLVNLVKNMGIPQEAVNYAPQYLYATGKLDASFMRKAYGAMDVLLSPSYAEGFGIPIIEAQACGTPVIAQDFTAMSQVAEVGWKVGGQRFYTPQESWQQVPDIEQIVWALDESYTSATRMREAAREFALGYDADRVMQDHWAPVLADLESRLPQEAEVLAA